MTEPEIWIWGRHPVLDALKANRAREVVLAAGDRSGEIVAEIRDEARSRAVPFHEVPPGRLQQLSGGANTQGIAARIRRPQTLALEDLLASLPAKRDPAFLVALDEVQDPHNLGSLARSAEAAGVQGIVMHENRSASITGTVVKASAGAAVRVPMARVTNLVRSLDALRANGIWTVGLEAEAPQRIYDIDLTGPICLVLGSEGSGLRRLTREHCDFLVSLPIEGEAGSLNVGAAGAVAMYEAIRQRLDK